MDADGHLAPIDDPALGVWDANPGGFPHVRTWDSPALPNPGGGPRYGEMISRLRTFLDHVAAARPNEQTMIELSADLIDWTRRLASQAVSERHQVFARRLDLPGRGQTMSPPFLVTRSDHNSVDGSVHFGRYFLGGNGAVHGGAIMLLFDEVLGRLANTGGRASSRTAYLNTDFRSIAPIGRNLSVRAWFVREEGRKRVLRGELRTEDTLCAESEGLFVALLPGQP